MASSIDPISFPRSAEEILTVSSLGLPGDDALSPSSPLASAIASPVIPGRSPRKLFFETQPPRSTIDSGSGNAIDVSSIPRGKKLAWNVPSISAIEVGSVMDTSSWPALSESARSSSKSSSSDSLKALSDGSICAVQVSLASSPSSKQASNNQNLNSSQSSLSPRDKTMKLGSVIGGGSSISGTSNVGLAMPSSLPVLTEASQSVPGKLSSLEISPKGLPNQNNSNNDIDRDSNSKTGGFSSHFHGGNDHQRGHAGSRRGNNGHHGNYNNRRDGERVGHEWSHRNFGRGVHMQHMHQQRGVGPFPRVPSVAAAPFIAPPLRPFSNHMGFPDFQSPIYYLPAPPHPESLRGVPFAPHPSSTPQLMIFPTADPQRSMLLKQIDYYFSPDNLCKDLYLRQNMDEEGWVPISLIAGFNRVKLLTDNIPYIVDTVQLSNVVEVQGDKIRKRYDWMAWLLNQSDNSGSATNFDGLAAHLDRIYLDLDASNNTDMSESAKNDAAFARSASVKLNSQISVSNSDGSDGQISKYADRIWNIRTLVRSDTM